jgi:membrane-bound metal-dependent hydrolase YbcI (DUF457 family)
MPVTPLHYPLAFLISKADKRLSLPGLIVGSVIPDIEVPFMWMFFASLPDHLFLHSLLGATTIGALLAAVITRFLYAPIISLAFRVEGDEVRQVCRVGPWMAMSCLIGVLSHLVLDFPMHWYNPILWPWVNPYDIVGPLVLIFAASYDMWTAYLIASSITHVTMMVLWAVILVMLYSKGSVWYRHWVKDTSGAEQIKSNARMTSRGGNEPFL